MAGSNHHILTFPAELRLRIYEYLLPLNLDRGDLRGLVVSCRTVKDEVYHEMAKVAQKARDELQARWPFEEPFAIPFLARLFRTGELLVEVPYLGGILVHDFARGPRSEARPGIGLAQQGGFALGARRVLLYVTQVENTAPLKHQEAEFARMIKVFWHINTCPPDRYLAFLLQLYIDTCNVDIECEGGSEEAEIRQNYVGHEERTTPMVSRYVGSRDETGKIMLVIYEWVGGLRDYHSERR
ncbi:hypothetical protein CC86DRAFT_416966 [Ophiobolus disseminans]|uniref:Uncharacterized protein n=1 Tax=Ophiobolus disseminans TaxID=1469910 RepID=A0A6A7A1F7_9PLEO|nr:hypothetical protein CC86DRAFT_416966 [Ophiobolus disseminans]